MTLAGNLYRIPLLVRKPSGEEFDLVRMVIAESPDEAICKVERFCKSKGWGHCLAGQVTVEQFEVWS